MSIEVVSVISSATVAVAGILATVLTRRTDRKHERAMIRESQMSGWEVEWWRRREKTYLDVLRVAEEMVGHLEHLNSIHRASLIVALLRHPPDRKDVRDLSPHLDAYGSTEINERYQALLDAHHSEYLARGGHNLKEALPLLRKRHYELARAIRQELAAGPTARPEERAY